MFTVSSLIATPAVATPSFQAQTISASERVLQRTNTADDNKQPEAIQALTSSTQQENDSVSLNNQPAEQDNAATLADISPFAPALQYNKLVSFSLVRYKPSDAGLSSSAATQSDDATQASVSSAQTSNDYQAYNNTQLRNLSELTSPASATPVQITG